LTSLKQFTRGPWQLSAAIGYVTKLPASYWYTTLLALDAHVEHPGPFTAEDVRPYRSAPALECQRQAMRRPTIMRQARSKTRRPLLLAELERRYLDDY
jgi:hypothetical protein